MTEVPALADAADGPKQPLIGMIWAQTPTGVIGVDNTVPWHVPEDFAHFRATTLGHPVVMGRSTWESLPQKFRPLPGRLNVVLTRQQDWQEPGAIVSHSLEQALELASQGKPEQIWIVGGSQIYAAALPFAQRLVITIVETEVFGHAFAPDWQVSGDWHLDSREPEHGWLTSRNGLRYRIEGYWKIVNRPNLANLARENGLLRYA